METYTNSISLDDKYGSNYFNQIKKTPTTTTSLTAMLAAAAAVASSSSSLNDLSINKTTKLIPSTLNTTHKNAYDYNFNIINNLTDDDDDDNNNNNYNNSSLISKSFNDYINPLTYQQKNQQFYFNESLELDDDILFNHNLSNKTSPPPPPPLAPQLLPVASSKFYKLQQPTKTNKYEIIKCASKKCIFNINGYKPSNNNVLFQLYCTNIKCKEFKIYFHDVCYETILNEININNNNINNNNNKYRARSFEYSYLNNNINLNQTIELTCMNCHNGYLKMHKQQHQEQQLLNNHITENIPSPPPSSSSSSSSSVSPPLNNHTTKQSQQQQQQQQQQQHHHQQQQYNNNNNNNKQQHNYQQYSSAPINIQQRSNMFRKRSIGGLNNPPLPIPMQPLHESETISTSPSKNQQQCNNKKPSFHQVHQSHQQHQQQNLNKNSYKLKQSAPVNMPNNSKNNSRTLSCGSTGSFSASSSFSSSFGTSPIVTNQTFSGTTTNLWKKMLNNNSNNNNNYNNNNNNNNINNQSSSYISTSGNYTGTSCSNSSVNSICTYRGGIGSSSVNGVLNNISNAGSMNNVNNCINNNNNNNNCETNVISTSFNNKQEIFEDKIVAASGNMFYKRDDWSILSHIPAYKQNTINIRLEDEGPYGNDEIRCYILSHFSSLLLREIKCVLCSDELKIYDRFPLIDGTLFLSPIIYDKTKAITAGNTNPSCASSSKEQYIYGVCLKCLNGLNNIKCKWCKQEWKSDSLQIGTLYKYDVFAAFPCCQKRLNCNKCNKAIIDINNENNGLPYFSSYSEEYECQHCKFKAYHFIKLLDLIYQKAG